MNYITVVVIIIIITRLFSTCSWFDTVRIPVQVVLEKGGKGEKGQRWVTDWLGGYKGSGISRVLSLLRYFPTSVCLPTLFFAWSGVFFFFFSAVFFRFYPCWYFLHAWFHGFGVPRFAFTRIFSLPFPSLVVSMNIHVCIFRPDSSWLVSSHFL
ncbi:hypothetical protein F4779DRAFT_227853 [Xylariaceae sp. FL0662B]|nr:hypothetical protein F4779DRAFT_227853 [Xylariaceae sp. FL0662B]